MAEIRWSPGRNGQGSVEVLAEGRWYALHSRFDPQTEASKIVAGLQEQALFVLWGHGSGYLVEALRSRFPNARISIHEPCPAIVELSRANRPYAYDAEIRLVPWDTAGTAAILDNWYHPALDYSVGLVESPLYDRLFPGATAKFRATLRRELDQRGNDYRTQAAFGRRWLHTLGCNLHWLLRRSSPGPAPVPAPQEMLVLGAGPSLESPAAQRWLDQHAHLPLLAADTTMAWCREQHRRIDWVASIDAQSISARHLAGGIPPGIGAWLDPACHPAYFRAFPQAMVMAGAHPLYRAVLQLAGLPAQGHGTGNVGQAMVSLALAWGVRRLYLGGLDFAYRPTSPYIRPSLVHQDFLAAGERTRPASQHLEELWLSDGERRGPDSIVTPRLDAYRQDFDALLTSQGLERHSLNPGWSVVEIPSTCRAYGPPVQANSRDLRRGLTLLMESLAALQDDLGHGRLSPTAMRQDPCVMVCLPVLASLQRDQIHLGRDPADTLENDMAHACALVRAACAYALEGSTDGRTTYCPGQPAFAGGIGHY